MLSDPLSAQKKLFNSIFFALVFNGFLLFSQDYYFNLSTENVFILVVLPYDMVAPFRIKQSKPVTEPWLNYTMCPLSSNCQHADRRQKKDCVQVL